mmetsp:Transcript_7418/g.25530  ORF Transcript_7418/g.25530 Transcript_7418/m.25530 type:complete len:226 (+) Transcript_7418:2317-2994(+)
MRGTTTSREGSTLALGTGAEEVHEYVFWPRGKAQEEWVHVKTIVLQRDLTANTGRRIYTVRLPKLFSLVGRGPWHGLLPPVPRRRPWRVRRSVLPRVPPLCASPPPLVPLAWASRALLLRRARHEVHVVVEVPGLGVELQPRRQPLPDWSPPRAVLHLATERAVRQALVEVPAARQAPAAQVIPGSGPAPAGPALAPALGPLPEEDDLARVDDVRLNPVRVDQLG